MCRFRYPVTVTALLLILACSQVLAANRITVESLDLPDDPGRVEIGVYIENDQPLTAIYLTLVLHSVHCGDSVVSAEIGYSGRLSETLDGFKDLRQFVGVTGTCGQDGFTGEALQDGGPYPVAAPPEAFLFIAVGDFPPGADTLAPGVDPPGTPSMFVTLTFPAGERGVFELDTSCVAAPNNYLFQSTQEDEIRPEFHKGVITVGDCCGRCHPFTVGNVNMDPEGVRDLNDILLLASYAFLSGDAPPCMAEMNVDGDPNCTYDLGDVLELASYAFMGGDPPAFCMPECE